MRRHMFAAAFVALPLATVFAAAQTSSAVPPARSAGAPAGIELLSLDKSVDACTDFYQFACGGWMAANPMPPDRQRWGRFNQLQEQNFTILRSILEAPNSAGDRKKASDYYAACMDEQAIERAAGRPVQADVTRIINQSDKRDLPSLLARLHSIGVNVFFRFGARTDLRDATKQVANVDQGGLGLPDRDYYLKTDPRSLELKQKYQEHVGKMFSMFSPAVGGVPDDPRAVVAIESALAVVSVDRTARRDPAATDHMMTRAQLQALMPSFDWSAYTAAAAAPAFEQINVAVPDYFKALDRLLASSSPNEIRSYLKWQLLNASAEMLPKSFADADFDFFSRTLGGQETQLPRWQRCVTQTDNQLGEALGKAFVDEAFGPAAKADTLKMVDGIKAAMKQDIDAASWMSEATKRAAEVKLNAVANRIGYPEKWLDYSAAKIERDDALGNLQRTTAFERKRTLDKIGKPLDPGEWTMTPPTVNAYYSADRNNINFPAGILQPPFYRSGRDAAVNYGGAGAVVGHELTHGFDDQGRKFDGKGSLRNWWTEGDAKAYEERASCIADQYSEYVVAGDTHLNGRLTLGENTADNGGLRLALMAYLAGRRPQGTPGSPGNNDNLDGFTPEQRLFIGFGQVWCENRRPEFERLRAATDPHSSGKYRVNGTVSNMPEFQKAFSCKAGAPMVRQNQCRVW